MPARCAPIFWFRLRLGLLLLLRYSLGPLTVYSFLWGIAALVLRVTLAPPFGLLLLGLAGVPVLLLVGLVRTLRRLPSALAVRALVDRMGRHGGLLLAEAETDLGAWAATLPEPALPSIAWNRGGRALGLMLLAALFVLLVLLVPQEAVDLRPAPPLKIEPLIQRLAGRIDLLRAVHSLDPARARALVEKLAALKTGASGRDPARTLEALDSLEALTRKSGRKVAETLLRDRESLQRLATLAGALMRGQEEVAPERLHEALGELAGALDRDGKLARELGPDLARSLRKQTLTREQLRQLDAALKKAYEERLGQIDKLHKAGLADGETVRQARKPPGYDVEGLLARLKDLGDKRPLVELLRHAPSGGPGTATPTQGKPGALTKPGPQEKILSEAELTKRRQHPAAASGALKGATAGGGSANTQVLLPRHRAVVGRYFERKGP